MRFEPFFIRARREGYPCCRLCREPLPQHLWRAEICPFCDERESRLAARGLGHDPYWDQDVPVAGEVFIVPGWR